MKKLTTSQVAAFIIKHQSAEFTNDTITYYLYLNEDGELHDSISNCAVDFSHDLSYADYGIDVDEFIGTCDEDEYVERWEDLRGKIYEHEEEGDPIFDSIIADLTAQANSWIEENA